MCRFDMNFHQSRLKVNCIKIQLDTYQKLLVKSINLNKTAKNCFFLIYHCNQIANNEIGSRWSMSIAISAHNMNL